MARNKTVYAVITADVGGSRRVQRFQVVRDRKLRELGRTHLQQGLILSDYAVTAWDEFEAILSKPVFLPQVIFDLRRVFQPLQLWIAVGMGSVSGAHRAPVNRFAGGEAFELARSAAEELKTRGGRKTHARTSFRSNNEVFNCIANTIYGLHDTLIEDVSLRQWEAINAQVRAGKQEIVAKRLKLDQSTVSRSLRRGYYWHMQETRRAMEQVIDFFW